MRKFFTVLFFLISASILFGQTAYYVDGTNGTDDGSHGGSSGTGAWKTIQYAITNVASPTTETIVINVAAGTYTEPGISIDRSFNSLSIIGESASNTIVQANANPNTATVEVFDIVGNSSNVAEETVNLQNLTIKNGVHSSASPPNVNYGGGGVYNDYGTVSIINCIVSNCTGDYGGGVYNSGNITLENTTVNNNSSYSSGNGGGFFSSNSSASSTFTNCTFSNNTANSGGALCIRGNAIFTNCTIANNTSTNGKGGGVYLDQGATNSIVIKNSIIANNGSDYELYRYDGTVTSNGYNIIGYYYGTGVTIASTGDWTDQTNDDTYDLVGGGSSSTLNLSTTLANNSTLNGTTTLEITSGSFAINAGNDTQGSHPVATPTTDQRGATRNGTPSDIGAYEYAGVVPVELTSFTANIVDGNVVLNWTTATEVNNYGFELQRSVVSSQISEKEWEVLEFIEGHGNSNSPKDYSFVDADISVAERSRSYRLKQIDTDGSFVYSDFVVVEMELSKEYKLVQNYPNPFNPSTVIEFALPEKANVKLKVYNAVGEEIATLVNGETVAGYHSVNFDASNLSSGIYFYRISAGNFVKTNKMILLR